LKTIPYIFVINGYLIELHNVSIPGMQYSWLFQVWFFGPQLSFRNAFTYYCTRLYL